MSAPFLLFGTGNVYLDILSETGAATGLSLKGNCTKLSTKAEQDMITEEGTCQDNFGQLLGSVAVPKSPEGEAEFNQFDMDIFAMIFLGSHSPMTQSAGSVPDPGQDVAIIADRMVELGKYKVADVIAKDSTGVTTYAEGADYLVNTRAGGITALSTGSIPAASVIKVSYSWPAIQGNIVAGMTKADVLAKILWEGTNRADGREFLFKAARARFIANTELNLQAAGDKKFVRASFKLAFETPPGASSPFELIWLS